MPAACSDLSKLIDKKTLSINPRKLVTHLNARQGDTCCVLPGTAVAMATQSCSHARCERGLSYFQRDLLLCRGHDLMEIPAIGFRSLFGSRSAAESSRENVESLFTLNYLPHFRATPMVEAIERWLNGNGATREGRGALG